MRCGRITLILLTFACLTTTVNGESIEENVAEMLYKFGNGTDHLNLSGFLSFLRDTFSKLIKEADLRDVFSVFDRNRDSKLSRSELICMRRDWLTVLESPKVALVVVDVQNDFINGNLSLSNTPARQNATEVIDVINALTADIQWDAVVFSKDWHPPNHISFYDSLPYWSHARVDTKKDVKMFDRVVYNTSDGEIEQILWPRHCVNDTWGSELSSKLIIPQDAEIVLKGYQPYVDSYSAFFDNLKMHPTTLHSYLQSKGITHVLLCGLAYDYCVGNTAFDAISLGYCVAVIDDCTKGMDMKNVIRVKERIYQLNGLIISAVDTEYLASGRELQWKWAVAMANKLKLRWGPPVAQSAVAHYSVALVLLMLFIFTICC